MGPHDMLGSIHYINHIRGSKDFQSPAVFRKILMIQQYHTIGTSTLRVFNSHNAEICTFWSQCSMFEDLIRILSFSQRLNMQV